jgi:hypothetical protein
MSPPFEPTGERPRRVSGNDRFPTLPVDPGSAQDTTVENPCRETTSGNPADRYCRRMLFGYARVSTADQNPAHQIDALTRAGVERNDIYLDTASGAKASRPQLDVLLKVLRRGDTLLKGLLGS